MATHLSPSRVLAPGTGTPPAATSIARALGPVALATLLAVHLIAPPLVASAAVPISVVGVLIGIPHGAVDHLVPFWAARRTASPRLLGALLTGYVTVAAAALACVLLAPVATIWVFLAVSALHFGRGEVAATAERAGRPVPGIARDVLPALAHGAVTVGLPLAAWSATSLPLLDVIAPGFAGTSPVLLSAVLHGSYALVVAAVALFAVRRRWWDAGELVLLALAFTLVPAAAAFGIYFAGWHSARHIARLVRLPGPDGVVDVRRGCLGYLRSAALPTVAALVLLAVVAGTGSRTVLTGALVTLVALTAPHLVVVAALDRLRGAPG